MQESQFAGGSEKLPIGHGIEIAALWIGEHGRLCSWVLESRQHKLKVDEGETPSSTPETGVLPDV